MSTATELLSMEYQASGVCSLKMVFAIREELSYWNQTRASFSDLDIVAQNAAREYLAAMLKGLNAYLRDNGSGVELREMEIEELNIDSVELY